MEPEPTPSAFGFKNIRPKTRRERLNLKDKVALEKQRLSERVGPTARQHQQYSHDSSAGLVSCVENGAGYMSNADRFHTDTSGEEFARRKDEYARKQRATEFRKIQSETREEDRWKRLEELKRAEEERIQMLREGGQKAKKNESGAAYDITNLQYHDTENGKVQQYSDDMVRYRAQIRARELVVKGDTRVGYNIINGDKRAPPALPSTVPPPDAIVQGRARISRGMIG